MPDIPRTPADLAERDRRTAQVVLDHPVASALPKAASVLLAHVAEGDHRLADADLSQFVLAALAVVVSEEIRANREMRP